jgi:hypothetical protein
VRRARAALSRGEFMISDTSTSTGGVPGVPAVSHPGVGRHFGVLSRSAARLGGVSRLSRLKYDPSHTRARTCAHTRLIVSRNSRDSRDTPARRHAQTPRPSNRRPGWNRTQPGHPGHPGWSA